MKCVNDRFEYIGIVWEIMELGFDTSKYSRLYIESIREMSEMIRDELYRGHISR